MNYMYYKTNYIICDFFYSTLVNSFNIRSVVCNFNETQAALISSTKVFYFSLT